MVQSLSDLRVSWRASASPWTQDRGLFHAPYTPGSSSRPIVLAACLGRVERPYNSLAINDGLYGGANPKTGQHVCFVVWLFFWRLDGRMGICQVIACGLRTTNCQPSWYMILANPYHKMAMDYLQMVIRPKRNQHCIILVMQ